MLDVLFDIVRVYTEQYTSNKKFNKKHKIKLKMSKSLHFTIKPLVLPVKRAHHLHPLMANKCFDKLETQAKILHVLKMKDSVVQSKSFLPKHGSASIHLGKFIS